MKALWPLFLAAGGITPAVGLDPTVAVALITTAGGGVAAYLNVRQRRQDRKIDELHQLVDQLQEERDAAREQQRSDRGRIDVLTRRVSAISQQLLAYKLGTQRLVNQITELGHEPAWRPPTPTMEESSNHE